MKSMEDEIEFLEVNNHFLFSFIFINLTNFFFIPLLSFFSLFLALFCSFWFSFLSVYPALPFYFSICCFLFFFYCHHRYCPNGFNCPENQFPVNSQKNTFIIILLRTEGCRNINRNWRFIFLFLQPSVPRRYSIVVLFWELIGFDLIKLKSFRQCSGWHFSSLYLISIVYLLFFFFFLRHFSLTFFTFFS